MLREFCSLLVLGLLMVQPKAACVGYWLEAVHSEARSSCARTSAKVQAHPLQCVPGGCEHACTTQSYPWCHVQAVRAPEYMELFTVMLGFDVSLTLPMLQQVVAEGGANSC